VPCVGWLGKATEELAARTGEGIGGLLNATFGNAAELIAFAALRAGLHDVVKASLAGCATASSTSTPAPRVPRRPC
jgi:Ca2+:H+ antiporter